MSEKRKHHRHFVEGMGIYARTHFNTEVEVLDISPNGGSIRSTKRFNIGGEYIFKFKHDYRVISLKGIIVWEKLTGSNKIAEGETMPVYTAGIKFKDVSTDKAEQLKEFISEKIRELRERRLSGVRIKIRPPEKAVLSFFETCVVKDISLGGMRVETEVEPTVESLFPLEVILAEDEKSIHCQGRIAFYHAVSEETPGRYSVGVEFMEMFDGDKLRLNRFIETLP